VNQSDIENVVQTARAIRMSEEQRILHVIPQEYTVDHQQGIKNPIGFTGMRMQAKVHLITCHNDMAKNILRAVERCGLGVDQLIYSGLASCLAVSSEDDRKLGVCVIDIGSSTIDIAIYTDGALRHVKVIPYAGNTITNDVAYLFSTSFMEAEDIKVRYGILSKTENSDTEDIILSSISGDKLNNIDNRELSKVIEPRYTELLDMVNTEIQQIQSQLRSQKVNCCLDAGIIITGGSAQISGLTTLSHCIFQMPVRIGQPLKTVGLPEDLSLSCFSTSIGLLHYGKELRLNNDLGTGNTLSMKSVFKRISTWFSKEF
jgi:cell division protein FtsA